MHRLEAQTFIFTDVERSSEAWLKRSLEMTQVIPAINGIIERTGELFGGELFGREGDGAKLRFTDPDAAIEASVAIQLGLAEERQATGGLQVRVGVHSGDVYKLADGDLGGTPLNFIGRLHSAGHGGQIIVSADTREAVATTPDRCQWHDLGVYSLRDFGPQRIWQLSHEALGQRFPPLRTRRRFEAPPPVVDPLVGREVELAGLREIASHRVTTLTGPGGIGKTRLARAAVERHGHLFDEGVCFIDLLAVSAPDQVGVAVANALGIDSAMSGSADQSIRDALDGSDVLLVLDNCEHVRSGVAGVVRELTGVSGPTVLTTSRVPLNVDQERVVPVGPLPTMDSHGLDESERLFEARASLDPASVDPDQRPLVGRICEVLGGVPLAIELVAARTSVLSLSDIASRLDDELTLLGRTSLQRAINWSLQALEPEAIDLASILARFRPDAALSELEQVVGQPLDQLVEALGQLVSHGIIQAEPAGSNYRYRLLQPFRYPLAQLGPTEEHLELLLTRHADAYGAVVDRRQADILGSAEIEAVDQLTAEFGNVRVAVQHDLANGREVRAAHTIAAFHMYCFLRMSYEIYDWADAALRYPGLADELRSELLGVTALGAFNRGALLESAQLAEQAVALAGPDALGPILAQVVLMSAHGIGGDFDRANTHLTAALRWCDERDEPCYRMNVLVIASMGMTAQGAYDVARGLAEHALSIAQDIANPSAVAWALAARADAVRIEQPADAALELQSALEIARSVSSRWVEGQILLNLSRAARVSGDLEQAIDACASALAHCQQHANLVQARQGLREALLLLVELGRASDAARLETVLRSGIDTLPPSPDQQQAIDAALMTVARTEVDPDPLSDGLRYPVGKIGEREALAIGRAAVQSCQSAPAS